jgi:hypothetical protein
MSIELWVIYDHPSDLPQGYVARRWEGETPTEDALLSYDLEALRDEMESRGLVCIPRSEGDEPQIVESWI